MLWREAAALVGGGEALGGMTDTIITKSIDSFVVVVEQEGGVDYVHVRRSDAETMNKDAFYFRKGDEAGAQKFLSSLAELIGVGPIVWEVSK